MALQASRVLNCCILGAACRPRDRRRVNTLTTGLLCLSWAGLVYCVRLLAAAVAALASAALSAGSCAHMLVLGVPQTGCLCLWAVRWQHFVTPGCYPFLHNGSARSEQDRQASVVDGCRCCIVSDCLMRITFWTQNTKALTIAYTRWKNMSRYSCAKPRDCETDACKMSCETSAHQVHDNACCTKTRTRKVTEPASGCKSDFEH